MRAWKSIVLFMAAVTVLTGCPATVEPPPSLGIRYFEASSESVSPGSLVDLRWSAVAVDDVCYLQATRSSGDEASEQVACVGERPVIVEESVTYQFLALAPNDVYAERYVTIGIETDEIVVTLLPGLFTVETGARRTLTATVSGTDDERLAWSASGGTLEGSGTTVTYVAPDDAGTYQVTASSVADASASDTATVTVVESTSSYTLSVDVVGNGRVTTSPAGIDCGTSCDAEFDEATSVSLTATPGDGWTFGGWTGDDDCLDGAVAMSAPRSCIATFDEPVRFTAVDANYYHSVALDQDGRAWAWGDGDGGLLGNGSAGVESTPVQVDAPAGVTFSDVAAGSWHTLALDLDGNAWAWGAGASGQLGNGGTATAWTPVQVTMPSGVTFTHVAAGGIHSLALDQDGDAWAWGSGFRLGNGSGTGDDATVPVRVTMPPGVTFTAVSARSNHSLALDQNGHAWAWGSGSNGQLGTGGTDDAATPVAVAMPSGTTFERIVAGQDHSQAIDQQGDGWSWGTGLNLSLGSGDTETRLSPGPVSMPSGVSFADVHASWGNVLARTADGNAWAWGRGAVGSLGTGDTEDAPTPVAVTMPADTVFTTVASGVSHSLALDGDGRAWAWGSASGGRLGTGSASNEHVPVQVAMPE